MHTGSRLGERATRWAVQPFVGDTRAEAGDKLRNIGRVSVWTIAVPLQVAIVSSAVVGWPAVAAAVWGTAAVALSALLLLVAKRATRAERRVSELRADLADANVDPVTGLAVRRLAERHIADTEGTDLTFAVIDVDDMHGINDAYSHDGGDYLLTQVAERLTEAAEPGDFVARLGGDEFIIITPRDPSVLARRLSSTVRQPVVIGGTTLPMRLSIGICRTSGGPTSLALSYADLAMFGAKRHGSGIEYYDPVRHGVPGPAARGRRYVRQRATRTAISPEPQAFVNRRIPPDQ
jgi:diguanylate cyclase (GGDEF)-like protein